MTRLTALLSLFLALIAPAPAQEPSVSASLFAKTDGDNLLVAIQMTPSYGCWIYDRDPGEFALPTTVEVGGVDGATWSEVWYPEPTVKETPGLGSNRIFKKRTVFYAAALGAGSSSAADVTAKVVGQVCNSGSCLNFTKDLSAPKEGSDELWAGFPAALLTEVSAEDASDAAPASGEEAAQADDHASDAPTWAPDFGGEFMKARFFGRVDEDDLAEVVVQISVPEGYHMYGGPTDEDSGPGRVTPTTVTIEGGGVEWEEELHFTRPEYYLPKGAEPDKYTWAYHGTFHIGIRGDALEGFEPEDIEILISGQSCDVNGCVPYENVAPEYAGEGDEALYKAAFASWTLPEVPEVDLADAAPDAGGNADHAQESSGDADADAAVADAPKEFGQGTGDKDSGFLAFILLSIGAGLITLLMPCTYPMIPITISFFTKQAEARNGNVAPLALNYGLGIVTMFVAIGVIFGPVMASFAGHYITNLVIGLLFLVFALALFGMIELRPPAFLMNFAGQASAKGGNAGVFLMGLTLVITSFTCTGPFVGSLLASGSGFSRLQIAIGMGFFGLTMATPFVLLALLPGRMSKMPSAGAWMNTLKVFMGFVELAASLKFFSNADIAEHWMILPREVFLILWAGIFVVAGMYLLGRINLKGESPDGNIGPGRMLGGLATVLFGMYCFMGTMGYRLDGLVMAAMAPPPDYTRGLVESHQGTGGPGVSLPEGIVKQGGSLVAIDDYDLARSYAIENGLGLLVNFTAHT